MEKLQQKPQWKFWIHYPQKPHHKKHQYLRTHIEHKPKNKTANIQRWDVPASPFYHFFGWWGVVLSKICWLLLVRIHVQVLAIQYGMVAAFTSVASHVWIVSRQKFHVNSPSDDKGFQDQTETCEPPADFPRAPQTLLGEVRTKKQLKWQGQGPPWPWPSVWWADDQDATFTWEVFGKWRWSHAGVEKQPVPGWYKLSNTI